MLSPKNLMLVVLDETVAERKNWALVLQFLFATDMHFDLSKGGRVKGDYEETEAWPKLLEKLRVATIAEYLPEENPVELYVIPKKQTIGSGFTRFHLYRYLC
jgi:hypothetical protein